MSSVPKRRLTPQEYLAIERNADCKSEYYDGEMFAMAGAKRWHNLIAGNVAKRLGLQLDDRQCEVYASDMRVKVSPTGMYTYPDVVIVCGEPHFEDRHLDTLTNPTVIVEVLSESTEAYDRGDKFAHYRRLESLTDYVLISQDKMRVEHYVRYGEAGKQWVLTEINDPNDTLNLTSLDCAISLRDIYEKVQLPIGEATKGPNGPIPQPET